MRLLILALLGAQVLAADYLLPPALVPHHYDLNLAFSLNPKTDFPFFGLVKIELTAVEATRKLVLHAQNFNISEENISIKNSKATFDIRDVKINDTYNFLTITVDKDLVKDENYTLTIPFYGNLKNGLDGVYISSYENKKTNEKEYLIATQFEAISARKGFPCFDEPMMKSTFRINIAHEKEFTAISNMPLQASSNENSMEEYWPWETMNEKFKSEKSTFVWDQFETSVPMSTYLVAYAVSKFAFTESPEGLSKTKFRIWARKDALDQTKYASEIGPKVLSYYEEWFGVPYPLPKQDMIAIPDFAAGAMENWGLITYRETALLYDSEFSSFTNKERVAEVIAHELAHQWFGNLVTMKWWSDLWLNEGFATYVASLGVRAVEPSWQTELTDAADNMRAVWALDSLQSSHPVSVPIDEPSRISEIFDQISYSKGSVLIRMMTMFLGEDIFRKALNNYLKKYSYKNAEQDDLWRELTAVSDEHQALSRNVTVKEIMDTWTKQTGYPLITVARDYSDGSLIVNQKRYLALSESSADPTTSSWWVPLKVLCEPDVGKSTQGQVQWLGSQEGTLEEYRFQHASKADQWLLFNAGMIAPYRVNYDTKNWQLLIKALHSDKYQEIPTLSRVQLVADAFELAWGGLINYTTTMELASYLTNETEFLPLKTGLSSLTAIEEVLKRSSDFGAFQKFIRKLITPTYERVGGIYAKRIVNEDDLLSVKMQVLAGRWACSVKVPGCEENAIEMFQSWMDTENPDEDNPIPLDLRPTVYCVAIRRGSVAHWRFLLARKQGTNVAAARQAMLGALACSRDVWILQQYLEWSIEGSEVRKQDAPLVISSIAGSTTGYWLGKEFLYNRIQDIHAAFGGQSRRIGGIIKTVLNQFTTQKELDEFLAWREENTKYLKDIRLSIDQAIENAKKNIGWVSKHKKNVVDLMRKYSANTSDLLKAYGKDYMWIDDEDSAFFINSNKVLVFTVILLIGFL